MDSANRENFPWSRGFQKKAQRSPGSNRVPTANRTDQSQPLYRLSQILILSFDFTQISRKDSLCPQQAPNLFFGVQV